MMILKTTYPCLVKTNKQEIEMEENDILEIEDEEFLFIYPSSAKAVPFYINLKSPKENENFSVLHREKQVIILLEKPNPLKLSRTESLFFDGKKCDVSLTDQTLCFDWDKRKLELSHPHDCKNFSVSKIKHYACAQFENDLYLFNVKTFKLSHICGNFEVQGDKITLKRNFADSSGRQKEATYVLADEVKLENEVFSSTSEIENEQLSPFKLMESVKAKDWNCAISFLSEKLKNSLKSEQIHEFFGNITSFLPLSTTEFITLPEKKFVKFELHNGKIGDISVDNLS